MNQKTARGTSSLAPHHPSMHQQRRNFWVGDPDRLGVNERLAADQAPKSSCRKRSAVHYVVLCRPMSLENCVALVQREGVAKSERLRVGKRWP